MKTVLFSAPRDASAIGVPRRDPPCTGSAGPVDAGGGPGSHTPAARPGAGALSAPRLSVHEDLAAVQAEWTAFEQRADCTVFQLFGWLSTWQLHIGTPAGTRPAIVIGRDAAGAILFLLPLAVEQHGLARRLVWLGSDHSDYNAPLLAPGFSQAVGRQGFASLWPEILRCIQGRPGLRFDLVQLVRMPQAVGDQDNPLLQLRVAPHPSGVYLAHLATDWDTHYAGSRSSATRRRERSKRRRLGALGEVRFVTPTASEEIAASIEQLVAQKKRWFRDMGVRNIFERTGCAAFYGALATHPAMAGIAHVSRLDVGTQAAAVNLGLTFRGRYYHLLASHAGGDLARFSPGTAHLRELLRHAIASGCRVFDFTIGDEPYKRDWSDTEATLYDHVAAAGLRGACIAPALRLAARSKRAIKRSPALWNAVSDLRALAVLLRRGGTTE